jgi:hypothetical protein
MLNPAVLAPMPIDRVSTAVIVNPGDFHSRRQAYFRSWNKACIGPFVILHVLMTTRHDQSNSRAKLLAAEAA